MAQQVGAQVGDVRTKTWQGQYQGRLGATWTLQAIQAGNWLENDGGVPTVTEWWVCTEAAPPEGEGRDDDGNDAADPAAAAAEPTAAAAEPTAPESAAAEPTAAAAEPTAPESTAAEPTAPESTAAAEPVKKKMKKWKRGLLTAAGPIDLHMEPEAEPTTAAPEATTAAAAAAAAAAAPPAPGIKKKTEKGRRE